VKATLPAEYRAERVLVESNETDNRERG
jgi:hypothetical protein